MRQYGMPMTSIAVDLCRENTWQSFVISFQVVRNLLIEPGLDERHSFRIIERAP